LDTRWGTFTDPWTLQPQPKCGFVLVGSDGTISSYDYEKTIRLQTRAHPEQHEIPVDEPASPGRRPIEYVLHCKETGEAIAGPLDPKLARIGQRIVDAAVRSAAEKRTVGLAP
jgi:predicted dehydrogenase